MGSQDVLAEAHLRELAWPVVLHQGVGVADEVEHDLTRLGLRQVEGSCSACHGSGRSTREPDLLEREPHCRDARSDLRLA